VGVPRLRDGEPGWLRLQGRTNARLHILAQDLDAEFIAPSNRSEFALVQGRRYGCSFEVRIVHRRLEFELRHYTAIETRRLDGEGFTPPDIDPGRVRAAIETAAADLSGHE